LDYILSLLGPLGEGSLVSLQLFFITLLLSIPLGVVLALMRLSRHRWLGLGVNGYLWLMRGTPLMLQLLFIYYALPLLPGGGIQLPDFPAAVVAFVLNYAARDLGPKIKPGMAFAIEPMLVTGNTDTTVLEDDWTVITTDGSDACQWEHSVAVHRDGLWVLTAEDGGASELARFGIIPVPIPK